MERFTVKARSGIVFCPKNGTKECAPDLCARCKHQIAAFNRLAEYEDTGLAPEEISALMTSTTQKTVDAAVDAAVEAIPVLVQAIVENIPQLVEIAAAKIHLQPNMEE